MAAAAPLRIGLVCESPMGACDGVSKYCEWLGAALAEAGHEVHQLRLTAAASCGTRSRASFPMNGNRIPLVFHGPRLSPDALCSLDVVHIQVPFSPFLTGRALNKVSADARVVATFHASPRDSLSRGALRMLGIGSRPWLRRIDIPIAVSRSAALAAWQTHGLRSKVVGPVLPISLGQAATRRWHGPIDGRALFVGRLVPRKEAIALVRAFGAMSANRRWHLHIVGDGPQRHELSREVRALGLQGRIRMLGEVDEPELERQLDEATVLCAPSSGGESLGMVLLQAFASETVAVGGNNSGYRDVLGPEQVRNVQDGREYAALVSRFLTDGAARERALKRQQRFLTQLQSPALFDELIGLYRHAGRFSRG